MEVLCSYTLRNATQTDPRRRGREARRARRSAERCRGRWTWACTCCSCVRTASHHKHFRRCPRAWWRLSAAVSAPALQAHEMIGLGGQEARHGVDFGMFFSCAEGSTPDDLLKRGIYSESACRLTDGPNPLQTPSQTHPTPSILNVCAADGESVRISFQLSALPSPTACP